MDIKDNILLDYYKEISQSLGVNDDGVDNNFSLEWFFNGDKCNQEYNRDCLSDLNTLTRAFLGDREAYDSLVFNSTEYDDIDEFLLEGKFSPNNNQRAAILKALNNSISFIQGPPGTGKTEVILNIASVAINTNKTVAIVSRNKATIDNIEIKLNEYEKNEFKVDNVLAKNQKFLFNSFAKLGNKSMRKAWNAKHGDSIFEFSEERINWEPKILASEFLDEFPLVTSTMHSLKKMFYDGDKYQYDYVIIDETSQCDILAGLIAMSSAKHLVMVGDNEQLQPIYNETYGIKRKEYNKIDECYRMEDPNGLDGQSILTSAEKVFSKYMDENIPYTFLNEHYRCHPGIIQFNKEKIYDMDDRHEPLKIMSKGSDVTTPIKVLWFDGNYCESCYKYEKDILRGTVKDKIEENKHFTKRNSKQIQVFIEEELPELYRRLNHDEQELENKSYDKIESVCIISPFKGQLDAIKEAIEESSIELEAEIRNSQGEKFDKNGSYYDNKPAMLTIHKSQGQEFDIVYLLPVEDGAWEWPWSQGKRLVNVAASRAKKELRIIVSRRLMGTETQRALKPDCLNGDRAVSDSDKEMFVRKMVEYCEKRNTRDYFDKIGKSGTCGFPESNYEFGFHKSSLTSIFDNTVEQKEDDTGIKCESKPEKCLCRALQQILNKSEFKERYAFKYEYALKKLMFSDESSVEERLKTTDLIEPGEKAKPNFIKEITIEEKKQFINTDSHFDFVIYDRSTGRVVLVIEIDGAYHRFDEDFEKFKNHIRNDDCKDSIVRDLGGMVMCGNDSNGYECECDNARFGFLRLPTDGTSFYETDKLKNDFRANKFSAYTKERHDKIVTIEDLIRKYSDINEDVYLKVELEGVTISKLAQRLKSDGIKITAKECNDILIDQGLLEDTNIGKRVSEKGRRLGIEQGRGTNAKGEGYIVPRYPKACAEKIIGILKDCCLKVTE